MTMDEFDELEYRLAEAKCRLELMMFDAALAMLQEEARMALDPATDPELAQQIRDHIAGLDTKYILSCLRGPFPGDAA